jgi:hypothetical protein
MHFISAVMQSASITLVRIFDSAAVPGKINFEPAALPARGLIKGDRKKPHAANQAVYNLKGSFGKFVCKSEFGKF